MSFKDELNNSLSRLVELESGARGLRNQNLADQIGHAIGRLKMACEHPDVDNVDRVKDGDKELPPAGEPLNSGGNLLFAAGDPGTKLQAEEAERRAAFDFAGGVPAPFPAAGPAAGEPVTDNGPNAAYPGDPQFKPEANNPGFRDPNNVELNQDGTLKSAPNSLGTADDNRDKK